MCANTFSLTESKVLMISSNNSTLFLTVHYISCPTGQVWWVMRP